jgi:hypothetical protein
VQVVCSVCVCVCELRGGHSIPRIRLVCKEMLAKTARRAVRRGQQAHLHGRRHVVVSLCLLGKLGLAHGLVPGHGRHRVDCVGGVMVSELGASEAPPAFGAHTFLLSIPW